MDWMAESDLKGKREVVAVIQFIVYRRIYLKGHSKNHKILNNSQCHDSLSNVLLNECMLEELAHELFCVVFWRASETWHRSIRISGVSASGLKEFYSNRIPHI